MHEDEDTTVPLGSSNVRGKGLWNLLQATKVMELWRITLLLGHLCVFQFCFDALDFGLWSKRLRFLQGRSFFLEMETRNEVL